MLALQIFIGDSTFGGGGHGGGVFAEHAALGTGAGWFERGHAGVEFGVVLNKNKDYVPKFIQQGLLGDE